MKKILSTTIAVGIFATMSITPSLAAVDAGTLPSLDSKINADVTTNGNNMNVQIQGGQGGVGTLNWNSFNVGSDAGVNFEFTAHNQTALNKVNASGGLSQIYGDITSSGCYNCGYEASGKVILLNPNGVLFGEGANVNLNSFTVSTFDGNFDKDANKLNLTKNGNSQYGIIVENGANIYGDKNVTFASDNVSLYQGSKISTSTIPNVGEYAYGKVKIVTADGVNFTYYNNGAVKTVSDVVTSADKMVVSANGEITSGHIDIRNMSNNADSVLSVKNATLKAVKAEKGNDGNIWLTSANKALVENANLNAGNNIKVKSTGKASIEKSTLNAGNDIIISSDTNDAVVNNTKATAKNNITISATGVASVQNQSELNAKKVTIAGGTRGQVVQSKVTADDIEITGKNVWFNKADLTATNNINAKSSEGYVLSSDSKMKAKKITLDAATNVTGDIDVQDSQTNLYAKNNVDVTLKNVGNRANGLIAEATDGNVTVTTDGTLSVSRIVAKKGDVTINANKVIAGLPYTTEQKLPGDNSARSYIEAGGKFTSNTTNDSYEVTASGDPVDVSEGYFNKRHHIQYGNGQEKILLVNKRPYTPTVQEPEPPVNPEPPVEPQEPAITVDNSEAEKVNKLPRRPETYNNNANIQDTRTTFVDVFAAASQIEIVEDEEE